MTRSAVTTQYLGRGLYTYAEAARLAGLSAGRVRAWFESTPREPRQRGPVLSGDFSGQGIISFLDLIEVLVAGHLRGLGISLQSLRKARAALVRYLHTSHPFSHRSLKTDGKALFIHLQEQASDEEELLEVVSQQHAIPQVLLPYLKRVDYDLHSKLATDWKIADAVVIDPTRASGKPIVASCAIPTSILAAAFGANGRDAERVANWYGISAADVDAAVRFENQFFGTAA